MTWICQGLVELSLGPSGGGWDRWAVLGLWRIFTTTPVRQLALSVSDHQARRCCRCRRYQAVTHVKDAKRQRRRWGRGQDEDTRRNWEEFEIIGLEHSNEEVGVSRFSKYHFDLWAGVFGPWPSVSWASESGRTSRRLLFFFFFSFRAIAIGEWHLWMTSLRVSFFPRQLRQLRTGRAEGRKMTSRW